MNEAHWHLVVNHLPIILPVVGVLVMVTGLVAKSEAIKRTAYMIFAIGAISAFAAMNTGEGAEEIVEKISGVSESYIETHEESAETFAIVSYILGGLSLLGLWVSFRQKAFSNLLSMIVLAFALVVLFFGKETGTTGGEIRHIEIRSDGAVSNPVIDQGEKDDDD